MNFKDLKLEVKQLSEHGQFEGYAAAFGNEDLGGDVIMTGAFSKTISDNPSRPLLWNHNVNEPIGVTSAAENAKGLTVNGQLNLDVQRARETHSLMKQGAVKGLSFGFDTIDKEYKGGIRYLKEVKLYEVSLVPFPMNPNATVTNVKGMEDLERLLHELIAFKGDPLSAEHKALIEQAQQKLSALQAAKPAPAAATHDELAPEILHAASDRIQKLLRGEF